MSSLSSKVLSSSSLLLATRLMQRSFGLISILILARLLTPDDFGVVAVAAITIHLFVILGLSGSEQYIIQKKDVDETDLNTAWTIDVMLKSGLWLLLVLTVPLIDNFIDGMVVGPVLYALSFNLIFEALNSPGLMLLKRNFDYPKIFKLNVAKKFIMTAVVLSFAAIYPSYWAIVVGDIVGAIVFLVGSYIASPYRPKFTLARFKEQWAFSHWMISKGILGYVRSQVDTILVPKLFGGAAPMGTYYLARDISMMPANEVVVPITEPLLASYARVKENEQEISYQVRLSLVVVTAIIAPVCFFMYFFPEPIVDVLLGAQWTSAYALFSCFSVLLYTFAIGRVFDNCCIALERVKGLFYYDLFSLVFITVGLVIFFDNSIENFALSRGFLQIATLLVLGYYITRFIPFSVWQTCFLCLPIVVASICGAAVTYFLEPFVGGFALFQLVLLSACLFSVYFAVLWVFYMVWFHRHGEYRHVVKLALGVLNSVINKIRPNKATV